MNDTFIKSRFGPTIHRQRVHLFKAFAVIFTVIGLLAIAGMALAQSPPLHPTFPLLDAAGKNVVETGNPVSTMQTCGGCHDTAAV